jgi:hypothetical protein
MIHPTRAVPAPIQTQCPVTSWMPEDKFIIFRKERGDTGEFDVLLGRDTRTIARVKTRRREIHHKIFR